MFDKLLKLLFPTCFSKPERARDERGRLVGDDKKTPTINEAWKGGKAPKKKRGRPPKKKK